LKFLFVFFLFKTAWPFRIQKANPSDTIGEGLPLPAVYAAGAGKAA
jgi:hypothetical protein